VTVGVTAVVDALLVADTGRTIAHERPHGLDTIMDHLRVILSLLDAAVECSRIGVCVLNEDFVGCDLKVLVDKVNSEASDRLVLQQDCSDFVEASVIGVIEARYIRDVRKRCPLHRSDVNRVHGKFPRMLTASVSKRFAKYQNSVPTAIFGICRTDDLA
jgi:hypothetical protein